MEASLQLKVRRESEAVYLLDLSLLLFELLMGPSEEEANILDVLKSICVGVVVSKVLSVPGRLFQMLVPVFCGRLVLMSVF